MTVKQYSSSQAVASWARKAREAQRRRDLAICDMRSEGASLREIAAAAGVTAPTVQRVLAHYGWR